MAGRDHPKGQPDGLPGYICRQNRETLTHLLSRSRQRRTLKTPASHSVDRSNQGPKTDIRWLHQSPESSRRRRAKARPPPWLAFWLGWVCPPEVTSWLRDKVAVVGVTSPARGRAWARLSATSAAGQMCHRFRSKVCNVASGSQTVRAVAQVMHARCTPIFHKNKGVKVVYAPRADPRSAHRLRNTSEHRKLRQSCVPPRRTCQLTRERL